MSISYKVERHSGLDGSPWRVISESMTEEKARLEYKKLCEKLRQGGVRILRVEEGFNGDVIAQTNAPRLRSVW